MYVGLCLVLFPDVRVPGSGNETPCARLSRSGTQTVKLCTCSPEQGNL